MVTSVVVGQAGCRTKVQVGSRPECYSVATRHKNCRQNSTMNMCDLQTILEIFKQEKTAVMRPRRKQIHRRFYKTLSGSFPNPTKNFHSVWSATSPFSNFLKTMKVANSHFRLSSEMRCGKWLFVFTLGVWPQIPYYSFRWSKEKTSSLLLW